MRYQKPSVFHYRLAQGVSWLVSKTIFHKKVLRNEIRGVKGPFVVIANHQAALDFVNLIGATRRPMHFVISKSFFSTLPVQGFMRKMGVIPKQQFQTSADDLKKMKTAIKHGQPVVIYPAGLMCEDGLSTPIPAATYKFLKWLDVDVYVARSRGTYFVMPKWSKGLRPGRTYMDIYKLFSKEELKQMPLEQVREKTNDALLFDAYREQDIHPEKYRKNRNIEGLEHVLYQCPHCGEEFTMQVRDGSVIACAACGFTQECDSFGLLHKVDGPGLEIRYVSDWSRMINNQLKWKLTRNPNASLTAQTQIFMVTDGKKKFTQEGSAAVTLNAAGFTLEGTLRDAPWQLHVPIGSIPTLPFSPGRYFEIQDGPDIYRCVLSDGKLVMKFINMVKVFYELNTKEKAPIG